MPETGNPGPPPEGQPRPPTFHSRPETPRRGPRDPDDAPTVISGKVNREQPIEDLLHSDLRGHRLAHFELIEPIGVGGMAAVLLARDTQLDRLVALKILPPEMAQDPENVQRFHQEARSAAKLDHDNVARVFFYGEDSDLHFIAFELVEGEDLRSILDRRGRLPVGEAIHYTLQITAGLVHAAERNVVHRDIKPSNILITPDGKAKLVDMGLARIRGPQADPGLTQSGVTLGTFDYISPEQALEPRDADGRSDIYSLGCTLYHAFTGQAPVPEGTAAKKLHCHQHVRPLDPRQLAPDLPDDAAVLLDRMMAKDPGQRYQSPTELYADLADLADRLQVAREGIPPEAGSERLSLTRPHFVLAGLLAIAAVLGLTYLLGQPPTAPEVPPRPAGPAHAGGPPGFVPSPPPDVPVAPGGGPEVPAPGGPEKPARQPAVWTPPENATIDDLADWLAEHNGADSIEIVLEDDLDLSPRGKRGRQGLIIQADKVHIRPREGLPRPTLSFEYDGLIQDGPRSALVIRARSTVIEGVRLVLDQAFAEIPMTGILFEGGDSHHLRDCEFFQGRTRLHETNRLASVAVAAEEGTPEVHLSGCFFVGYEDRSPTGVAGGPDLAELRGVGEGGQDAVRCRGTVGVTAEQCAFAPHQAVFRLEGIGQAARVNLLHSSVLLGERDTAFDLADRAGGQFKVSLSLFSHLTRSLAGPPLSGDGNGGDLIRQGDRAGPLRFNGLHNIYHRLRAFLVPAAGGEVIRSWEDFRDRLALRKQGDDNSSEVLESPWLRPGEQARRLERGEFRRAFLPRADLAEIRDPNSPRDHLVGVEQFQGKAFFPEGLPPVEGTTPDPAPRELVVDPRVDDSLKNIYPKLESAIVVARPGDTILLRVNGELPVAPLRLDKRAMRDLTIRAYEGYRPVIVLGEAPDRETALFEVHDGELKLEGILFRLRCRAAYASLSLVALVGEGACSFRRCVITLDRAGQVTPLALARLPETGGLMKAEPLDAPPAPGPRVTLHDTVVRGDGSLLWSAGRAFRLHAVNSFVALADSFLDVYVPAGAVAPRGRALVQLERVTAYLAGHLVRIEAQDSGRAGGWVPIRFEPDQCLFAPAPTGRALVHLEGIDPDREALATRLLIWKGGQNAYGAFASLLDHPSGPGGMGLVMPKEQFRSFTKEVASHFGVKPDAEPRDTPFPAMTPAGLVLPEDMRAFGADLDHLPKVPAPPRPPRMPEMRVVPE